MASKQAQAELHKAAAQEYQSRLLSAASKDEALTLAVDAAESYMKALQLTSRPEDKKTFRTKFSELAATAEKIKHSESWSPEILTCNLKDNDNPKADVEDYGKPKFAQKSATAPEQRQDPPFTWSASQSVASARPPGLTMNAGGTNQPYSSSASSSSKTLPRARRLQVPRSTRKPSKREDIILLKASVVHGFKCPPWTKPPAPNEFALRDGQTFLDTPNLSLSKDQHRHFRCWARAEDAMPPPTLRDDASRTLAPVMTSENHIDLVQDVATDCSVVASLCAGIAREERGHEILLPRSIYPYDDLLGQPMVAQNGKYIIRLYFNGCWRKVIVDDRLPLSSTDRLLHVVDRGQPGLLWPALLEKAYLKVRGGYNFPGSNSCSDLWILTGWIPEQVHLQEIDTIPDELWKRTHTAFTYGDVLVTLGTGRLSKQQEREFGLESQHSYAVIDIRQHGDERQFLVKNPWVKGRRRRGLETFMSINAGASASAEKNVGDEEASEANRGGQDSAMTSWISFDQVIRHYECIYLNWNPGLFTFRQDVHFDWSIDELVADGLCIVDQPQFLFWTRQGGTVWLVLSRHFRDAQSSAKKESRTVDDTDSSAELQTSLTGEEAAGFMSVCVCDAGGHRKYVKDHFLESSDYVTAPQCLLRWEADPDTPYTLVIDQDGLPKSAYSFTLSAFSATEMQLENATQPYIHQQSIEDEWSQVTAGGGTSSSRYFNNPQYTLELKSKTSLAILLTSKTHSNPMHVKLALGHGKRMHRLQSRDVLVDSGDHRGECVFAETKDLEPGLYTIICSLFEAGRTGAYTLQVDSTAPVNLRLIPKDGAGLIFTKLAAACFGPRASKVAAPLMPHRLASYIIVARFARATTTRAEGLSAVAQSPFRFSVEYGRGPDRHFVIASEQGEYVDAAIVRSEPINIDPALYNVSDLWLVLDRLAGPGQPVEEWYDVDLFTDVPHACSIGVWRDWD